MTLASGRQNRRVLGSVHAPSTECARLHLPVSYHALQAASLLLLLFEHTSGNGTPHLLVQTPDQACESLFTPFSKLFATPNYTLY